MTRVSQAYLQAVCAIILLLPCVAAQSQARYRLKEVYAVGDRVVNDETMTMSLTLNLTAAGQNPPPFQFSGNMREVYADTLLAVNLKSKPDAIRRKYTVSRDTETTPDGKKDKVSTLIGKIVTVRRVGGKVAVSVDKGTISDDDRKKLMKALDHSSARFFPDNRLAIGEEWSLNLPNPSEVFEGATKAEVKGRLAEVTEYAGHRAAHLKVTVVIAGKMPNTPLTMEVELSGSLYQALDINRPLAGDLKGPINVTVEMTQQGVTMKMEGRGMMTVKMRSQWLEVGKGAAVR